MHVICLRLTVYYMYICMLYNAFEKKSICLRDIKVVVDVTIVLEGSLTSAKLIKI